MHLNLFSLENEFRLEFRCFFHYFNFKCFDLIFNKKLTTFEKFSLENLNYRIYLNCQFFKYQDFIWLINR
jgi:hypothetical protein